MDDRPRRDDGLVRRLLTLRIPLWTLLAFFVLAVAAAAWMSSSGDEVELGPAVGSSEEVRVTSVLCNHVVDRNDVNPRHAELTLERALRKEGAKDSAVKVTRRDCATR